jgi:hypothetical protein
MVSSHKFVPDFHIVCVLQAPSMLSSLIL